MGEKEIMSEEGRGGRRGTEEREVNAGVPLKSLLVRYLFVDYLFVDCLRSGTGKKVEEGRNEERRKSRKNLVGRLWSVFRYAIFV
jgi:hypothetical protein